MAIDSEEGANWEWIWIRFPSFVKWPWSFSKGKWKPNTASGAKLLESSGRHGSGWVFWLWEFLTCRWDMGYPRGLSLEPCDNMEDPCLSQLGFKSGQDKKPLSLPCKWPTEQTEWIMACCGILKWVYNFWIPAALICSQVPSPGTHQWREILRIPLPTPPPLLRHSFHLHLLFS